MELFEYSEGHATKAAAQLDLDIMSTRPGFLDVAAAPVEQRTRHFVSGTAWVAYGLFVPNGDFVTLSRRGWQFSTQGAVIGGYLSHRAKRFQWLADWLTFKDKYSDLHYEYQYYFAAACCRKLASLNPDLATAAGFLENGKPDDRKLSYPWVDWDKYPRHSGYFCDGIVFADVILRTIGMDFGFQNPNLSLRNFSRWMFTIIDDIRFIPGTYEPAPPPSLLCSTDWRSILATIIRDQDFALMPVLADSLEDAGYPDRELIAHLRSPGPHCLGCWAIHKLTRPWSARPTWFAQSVFSR